MYKGWKKAAAVVLSAAMTMTALAGCSKKKETEADAAAAAAEAEAKPMITLGDKSLSSGAVNFMLRYEMATDWISSFYRSMYGQDVDIWDYDMYGNGQVYGEQVKEELLHEIKHMMLEESHMADYGVELTEDEKAAVTRAAEQFIADNDPEVLEKMSATQENVETMLTYRLIQSKMEKKMSENVDTFVSDEEAAQRDVSYVEFQVETETETEGETEDLSEAELPAEAETAAEETAREAETAAETAVEEAETALVEEESEIRTQSSDEAGSEAAPAEAVENESEAETEDPALTAAREEMRVKAEAFLAEAASAADADAFTQAANALAETDSRISASTWTFGKDDTYPDASVIEATEGLADNTLVNQVFTIGDAFYVIYVADAFDEQATEDRKEEIVEERRQAKITQLLESWESGNEDAEAASEGAGEASTEQAAEAVDPFEIDQEAFAALAFEYLLFEEQETEDAAAPEEELSEAATDVIYEDVTESGTETAAE